MSQAEADIGLAAMAQPLERRQSLLLELPDAFKQETERLVAKRDQDRFLVLEIEVERRRRHADLIGDPADRGRLIPLPQEELLGGLEDLVAPGMPLAALFPGTGCCRGQFDFHPLTYN